MRVLFLIAAFIPMILSVQAQRNFSEYVCQLTHKTNETAFYLRVPETKEVEINGWKILTGIQRVDNQIEVSLEREIDILDANYKKAAKRQYPLNARYLPVELEHNFGGHTDLFTMACSPRDP